MNQTTPHPGELLERPEVFARRVDVSRGTVYNWLAAGMPALKLGRSRRIDPAEAIAWLKDRSGGDGV